MSCKMTDWILWAAAMMVFQWLLVSGRTLELGMAIAGVAVLWYVIMPAVREGRQ
jgi:arginine exporter protein ArgO